MGMDDVPARSPSGCGELTAYDGGGEVVNRLADVREGDLGNTATDLERWPPPAVELTVR
jgi:hypothetical protein